MRSSWCLSPFLSLSVCFFRYIHYWAFLLQVYLDDASKPEVGHGLNKAAEVTMLRVHRLDKTTGKPTTDPEAIDRCG